MNKFKNLEDYIKWTRVNNCINGNPRFVCHFLNFKPFNHDNKNGLFTFEDAVKIAKTLGGKRFHNKQYGGGILFSSYNLQRESESILLHCGDAIEYESKSGESKVLLKKDVIS